MPNNTVPRDVIQPVHTAREYETKSVPEAALQNFGPGQFVMNSAGGYILFDGTTNPATTDVAFLPAPPHNYSTFIEGRNQFGVLVKHQNGEIEIDLYNGGTVLTQAQLAPGTKYGVTRLAANPAGPYKGGEGMPTHVWYLDVTKTANPVLQITQNALRGFTATGAILDANTGGIGDKSARVLAKFINL